MRLFIFYLTILIFTSSLASCQNTESSNKKMIVLGNFNLILDENFQEKKLYGNDLEDAKNIFKPTGFPPPNKTYLNIKSNKDYFSCMAICNNLGHNYGKNEDFDSFKTQELIEILKVGIVAGNLSIIKINNFNIIKHSIISNEYNQRVCYYYIFDYDKMINIFISYPINSTKWESIENSILKTIKRKSTLSNIYSLNKEDNQEIKEIFKSSLLMDTLTIEQHLKFWQIIDKYGGNPDNIEQLGKKEKIYSFLEEVGLPYQKAFYEDALISLKKGQVFQSLKRKELEEKLTEERIIKNKKLLENISKGKTIPYNGENIIINEEIIENILNNIDSSISIFKNNIDLLYEKTLKK